MKPTAPTPSTPPPVVHRLSSLLRRGLTLMGTTVSLSSSPEPPADADPSTMARFFLSQQPLRMGHMLRLARLLNDSTAEEKLTLFDDGVLSLLLRLVADYARPDGAPTMSQRNSVQGDGLTASKKRASMSKGVGYGTGTTKSRWDLEKTVERRLLREEHLVWLLNSLTAFLYGASPDFSDPDQVFAKVEATHEELQNMKASVAELISVSALLPLLEYHLNNESIFDVSQHMELYQALLEVACSMALSRQCVTLLLEPRPSGQSIIRHLVPRFRDALNVYLSSPKGQASPDFRLIDFIYKVGKWSELLAAAAARFGLRPSVSRSNSTGGAPGRSSESSAEGGAGPTSATPPLLHPKDAAYTSSLGPLKVTTWKFIGDYGKLIVPYFFKKEAKSLNPFSPSLKERTKRIVKELASLHTGLPLSSANSIFVCVDEARCDIMKVLIIGPDDTPYESGAFEFDIFFPSSYPFSPPKVAFLTTGGSTVRFNPNLYNDGKVCLSILGTWEGRPEEKWSPHCSLLQVLISIQGLIFVAHPYFNEPGFERYQGTSRGRDFSRKYNLQIEHATLHFAIRNQLKDPPPHFHKVVQRHFWHKRAQIVDQSRRWMEALHRDQGAAAKDAAALADGFELDPAQMRSMEKTVQLLMDEILAMEPPETTAAREREAAREDGAPPPKPLPNEA